jgi:hypothetical protein
MAYPQAYNADYSNLLAQMLGGSQSLGTMGLQGISGAAQLAGPYAGMLSGNSSVLGAVLGALGAAATKAIPALASGGGTEVLNA